MREVRYPSRLSRTLMPGEQGFVSRYQFELTGWGWGRNVFLIMIFKI